MIADRDQYDVQSTLTGEKVSMGIAVEDMAHIMGVLTDLYSNKPLAVIREYSTNALDAQIEAGVTAPIRVTLPNALAPFFKVADSGTGLTVEDIHSIYSQYGRSTKRGSNDVVGMLGLGCKSALTYCSQFTVSSVKNGTKVIVAVSREGDGSGSMTVVDTVSTDESNGTEVVVPVARHDHHQFDHLARTFYSFWKPGTVLLNGEDPKQFTGLAITDNLFITADGPSRVVMGNVAYPAPQLDRLCPSGYVTAFVGIGEVNFPPSREALMDTRTTRATIEAIQETFAANVAGAVQREIDKCDTPAQAVSTVVTWNRYMPHGSNRASAYVYKGDALPASFVVPQGAPAWISSSTQYGNLGASSNINSVTARDWPSTVWVEGFFPGNYTAQHKRKMLKAVEGAGLENVQRFVCTSGSFDKTDPAMKFIDPARILQWEVVRKIQLQPRATRTSGARLPGSYDIHTEDGQQIGIPGDDIRQELPIFYVRGNRYMLSRYATTLRRMYPQFTLVALAENRVAKFCRLLPETREVTRALREDATKWSAALPPQVKLALSMREAGLLPALRHVDPSRVNDPAIIAAKAAASLDVDRYQRTLTLLRQMTYIENVTVDVEDPFQSYPLIASNPQAWLMREEDHFYLYVNAAYAAK
jgi:hypothetical protein